MADPSGWHAVPRRTGVDVGALARLSVLAALAIVGRVAFLWAPNYALTYFVVFLAGVLDGKRAGAAVGLIAMTVTNLMFSGLHPVLIANGLAMAGVGVLGGLVAPWVRAPAPDRLGRALAVTLLTASGIFAMFLFSVASDLAGYVMTFLLTPEGRSVAGPEALVSLVLLGLAFNLGPALANAVAFPVLTPAVLVALRKAGHLRRPAAATDVA